MQMDAGLDTGDMLLVKSLALRSDHTGASLHDELAECGAQAIVEALQQLQAGQLSATPQPEAGVTYAEKLQKSEAALDFSLSASALARRIRAFNPVPGCTLSLPGLDQPVKVWQAQVMDQSVTQTPGSVVAVSNEGIDIATVDGVLRVTELQRAGSRRQPVAAFVQGWQLN